MATVVQMDKDWDVFCRNFDVNYFKKAMKQWVQIDQDGVLPIDLLKVNTKQILEKEGF